VHPSTSHLFPALFPCILLIESWAIWFGGAAMERFEAFRSILVGVDGSPEARRAVDIAFSLAKHYSSKLTLLWVKTPPPAEEQAEGYGLDEYQKAQERLHKQLERSEEEGRQQGLDIAVAEICGNAAAKEIKKFALEHHVDLLVVGHRRLSHVRHLIEGSTSEALLQHSPTSMLIVH
jgi:nucleotide-binding universal stress UspA family protein